MNADYFTAKKFNSFNCIVRKSAHQNKQFSVLPHLTSSHTLATSEKEIKYFKNKYSPLGT